LYLLQSFKGVKDIILFGKANYFISRFKYHNSKSFKLNIKYVTLQNIPRLWFEVVGVVGLVFLISFLINQGRPFETIVPTLSIFIVSAFRIIPSLNRTVAAIQTIKYAEPSINLLYRESKNFMFPTHKLENKEIVFNEKIQLKDVYFSY